MPTMARLLLLPGNNPDQREWIEAVRDELLPIRDAATILYYGHWEKADAPYIDFDKELARLGELAPSGPWIVLAKSAGVLLALMAAARGILVPQRAFFLGAPFTWTLQQGMPVAGLLEACPPRAVFVQQTNDPSCPVAELTALLSASGVVDYQIEAIPGASHDYGDLVLIRRLVEKHLAEE